MIAMRCWCRHYNLGDRCVETTGSRLSESNCLVYREREKILHHSFVPQFQPGHLLYAEHDFVTSREGKSAHLVQWLCRQQGQLLGRWLPVLRSASWLEKRVEVHRREKNSREGLRKLGYAGHGPVVHVVSWISIVRE